MKIKMSIGLFRQLPRLRGNVGSVLVRGAHFQFYPETPDPAAGKVLLRGAHFQFYPETPDPAAGKVCSQATAAGLGIIFPDPTTKKSQVWNVIFNNQYILTCLAY
jgi:hypothetical protein